MHWCFLKDLLKKILVTSKGSHGDLLAEEKKIKPFISFLLLKQRF